MIGLLGRYHRHLVSKGAATPGMDRYFGVQSVAMPWLAPLFGLLIWGLIFDPADDLRKPVTLLVGVPTVLGTFYAMTTYMIAGFIADWSRRKRGR